MPKTLRKPVTSVIFINSARDPGYEQPPDPQPAQSKRPFFGNQHTEQRFYGMYRHWADKVARHYRIPPYRVDEQIVDALAQRRAA